MKDFLDEASAMYYAGTPIMSDAEFDVLVAHYDYKGVGHTITDGIPHYYRMYSLQNIWDLDDAPFELHKAVESPKLDGAAISILYVNGQLKLSLTRGDGKLGREITDKVATLVPNEINIPGIIQINGEVVASASVKNSRNVAAGALGLKNMDEFISRGLTFIAYDLRGSLFTSWTDAMYHLESMEFRTVRGDISGFPTDGVVYRIDDVNEFEKLGHTSKHPRGAFALKRKEPEVVTQLLDVIWQVGKTGVVSPVAVLEPVEIGGAMVARATLHNIEYIEGLDLEIGCAVKVIRSGEIIPRIVGRV